MRHSVFKKLSILSLIAVIAGCESAGKNTAIGAGAGAVAGGVLGAVVGHQTGKRGQGAAIGAVIGGGLGGAVGNRMDRQAKELAKIAETKRTDQGLITKLKSDILFDTGKYDLKPAALTNLQQMAAIIKKYPENVLTIKGYTDNTGSMQGNVALSQKRGEAVQIELIKGGVPHNTISVVGMGRENPIADTSTPEGRSKNRRVEIEITVDQAKVPKN